MLLLLQPMQVQSQPMVSVSLRGDKILQTAAKVVLPKLNSNNKNNKHAATVQSSASSVHDPSSQVKPTSSESKLPTQAQDSSQGKHV